MQNYTVHARGLDSFEKTCDRDKLQVRYRQVLPTYEEYMIDARFKYNVDEIGFVMDYNPNEDSYVMSEYSHFLNLDREELPIRYGINTILQTDCEDKIKETLSKSGVDYIIGSTSVIENRWPSDHLEKMLDNIKTFKDEYDIYAGIFELDNRYLQHEDLIKEIFSELKDKALLINASKYLNMDILDLYIKTKLTSSASLKRLKEELIKISLTTDKLPYDEIKKIERKLREEKPRIIVGNDAHKVSELNTNLAYTLSTLKNKDVEPVSFSKRKIMIPSIPISKEY